MNGLAAAAGVPLIDADRLDAPLAWRGGTAVTGRAFLADAARLAARLPAEGPAVNLCTDRYRFAVGLAAALLRGHLSLLPPNALPDTLARLATPGATAYALVDDAPADAAGLPQVRVEDAAVVLEGAGMGDGDGNGDGPRHHGGEGEAVGTHRPLPGAAVDVAAMATAVVATTATTTAPSALAVPRLDPALPAACLLTSGSTGAPQPHGKTWGDLARNIGAEAERLAELTGQPSLQGLTLVATVPPQHSYGFESSVLLALLGGAAFESGRPFFPADIAAALDSVPRPRALVTTPFHLKTLLASGQPVPPCDLVVSATAPLSPQLAAAAERAFGAPLVEIYGCTEAGQVATRRPVEGEVWTTFGELRLHAEPVPAGDRHDGGHDGGGGHGGGEGTGRSDGDDAAPPRERFVVQGGHVAVPTPLADVLELIDARRFRLLGRAGDVIHVAGKRSSLAHLNFHLNSIPGVEDGAFWVPADVADGVVRTIAFVVAPTLGDDALRAALRQRIEPAFLPRRIVRLPALPRAATGKLTVDALAALARTHGGAEEGGR